MNHYRASLLGSLSLIGIAFSSGSASAGQVITGTGTLGNQGKCLDDPSWNVTNGTGVDIWDCNGGSNQVWDLLPDGTIRPSFDTSKCLDLPSWDTANGTGIEIWDCNGGSNQQWTAGTDGTLRGYGDKCVDDPGGNSTDGTVYDYWQCNGGANQLFAFTPTQYQCIQFMVHTGADNVESGTTVQATTSPALPGQPWILKSAQGNVTWNNDTVNGQPWTTSFNQVFQEQPIQFALNPPIAANDLSSLTVTLVQSPHVSSLFGNCTNCDNWDFDGIDVVLSPEACQAPQPGVVPIPSWFQPDSCYDLDYGNWSQPDVGTPGAIAYLTQSNPSVTIRPLPQGSSRVPLCH